MLFELLKLKRTTKLSKNEYLFPPVFIHETEKLKISFNLSQKQINTSKETSLVQWNNLKTSSKLN